MKQQLNEIKRMQQLAGLSEADLPGDIARDKAIDDALEGVRDLVRIYGDKDEALKLIVRTIDEMNILEEYYGFAKDQYSDFTDEEDNRYNKIINFVTEYVKEYTKEEAENKLNEIIFGNTSFEKELWETGNVEKLGVVIAESILKL